VLRLNRYGEYCFPQLIAANEQTFDAQWVTDLEASYTFFERYTFSLGVLNHPRPLSQPAPQPPPSRPGEGRPLPPVDDLGACALPLSRGKRAGGGGRAGRGGSRG
jgi:hypothetical protein